MCVILLGAFGAARGSKATFNKQKFAIPQISLATLLLLIVVFFFPQAAHSEILNEVTIVAPASPVTSPSQLQISTLNKHDPQKDLWVTYNLVAVSDQDKPSGEIVIEAMPEGVMVPIQDTKVTFNADDMNAGKTTNQFKETFEKQAGKRSTSELNETFGVELTKAIIAMKENKGTVLTQNITKHYPAPGKNDDLRILTSFEKIDGIQPAVLIITIGQGDIPEASQKDLLGKTGSQSRLLKTILGLLAILIIGSLIYQKFKE